MLLTAINLKTNYDIIFVTPLRMNELTTHLEFALQIVDESVSVALKKEKKSIFHNLYQISLTLYHRQYGGIFALILFI